MRRKDQAVAPQAEEKMLDVSASMQGTLRFDDPVNLRINGKFEGTLDTKGKLVIGQKADIKANITGDNVFVSGNVRGNIKAGALLRLEATAVMNGDIETPRFAMAEGAVLNGALSMTAGERSGGAAPRGDWMTINQLAKYLEVDTGKVNEWVTSGTLTGTKEGGEWVFERSKVDQWISDGKVTA
jgi:excisionase family DNA binding protein